MLDGSGTELDALKHARIENVDAGVDAVADKLDGLFNEALDFGGRARLVHHDSVLGGLFDLCHHDGALVTVVLVEIGKLLEGVVASDVGVEDEKGGVVLAENGLGELKRPSGAEWFCLDREGDCDVVLFLVLCECRQ